ncbi:MAG: site-2 protease family protein [Bacillota bacterium]|nr:site-2 protease family protein [Bacillota bacterium]REJ36352.1 MAG: site-2 protease family protein [Bacillota bacterium]
MRGLEAWILRAAAVLLVLAIHEYAHAAVAVRLGDPRPKFDGRLTLNPLAHLDPIGTLMLLFFGFGWAKPVIVDPTRFKNPRRDMMWVALAGPAANLLLAFVMARVYPFLVTGLPANWAWAVRGFFQVTITLNIWLAVFNLLPLPPLDGSKVLAGLVPRRWAFRLYNLETYGTVVLLLLIVSGMVSRVLWPAYRAVAWLILGG